MKEGRKEGRKNEKLNLFWCEHAILTVGRGEQGERLYCFRYIFAKLKLILKFIYLFFKNFFMTHL